jgi:tripartite-type tricarboxylate transporter receptor subunit TctC
LRPSWAGLLVGLAAGLAMIPSAGAWAQDYPAKPVRLVVPFPPGGGVDNAARLLATALSEGLHQQFVVDNRPGAGGIVATEMVAHAPADGYTLLFGGTATHGITPNLYRHLPYDAKKDFVAVASVGWNPFVLVINPQLPVHSVGELIALAKARPGKLNFSSAGTGSALHLTGELFKSMAGIDIVHVPYKGGAQQIPDIVSGQVAMGFFTVPTVSGLIKDGRLRALATTGAKRSALAPDLPTIAESGVPGYEAVGWYGIFAPAGTPPDVVTKLNRQVQVMEADPAVMRRFATAGIEPMAGTPQQFTQYVDSEIEKWGKVVRESGATAD